MVPTTNCRACCRWEKADLGVPCCRNESQLWRVVDAGPSAGRLDDSRRRAGSMTAVPYPKDMASCPWMRCRDAVRGCSLLLTTKSDKEKIPVFGSGRRIPFMATIDFSAVFRGTDCPKL